MQQLPRAIYHGLADGTILRFQAAPSLACGTAPSPAHFCMQLPGSPVMQIAVGQTPLCQLSPDTVQSTGTMPMMLAVGDDSTSMAHLAAVSTVVRLQAHCAAVNSTQVTVRREAQQLVYNFVLQHPVLCPDATNTTTLTPTTTTTTTTFATTEEPTPSPPLGLIPPSFWRRRRAITRTLTNTGVNNDLRGFLSDDTCDNLQAGFIDNFITMGGFPVIVIVWLLEILLLAYSSCTRPSRVRSRNLFLRRPIYFILLGFFDLLAPLSSLTFLPQPHAWVSAAALASICAPIVWGIVEMQFGLAILGNIFLFVPLLMCRLSRVPPVALPLGAAYGTALTVCLLMQTLCVPTDETGFLIMFIPSLVCVIVVTGWYLARLGGLLRVLLRPALHYRMLPVLRSGMMLPVWYLERVAMGSILRPADPWAYWRLQQLRGLDHSGYVRALLQGTPPDDEAVREAAEGRNTNRRVAAFAELPARVVRSLRQRLRTEVLPKYYSLPPRLLTAVLFTAVLMLTLLGAYYQVLEYVADIFQFFIQGTCFDDDDNFAGWQTPSMSPASISGTASWAMLAANTLGLSGCQQDVTTQTIRVVMFTVGVMVTSIHLGTLTLILFNYRATMLNAFRTGKVPLGRHVRPTIAIRDTLQVFSLLVRRMRGKRSGCGWGREFCMMLLFHV